jgi:hypothetical protein
MNFGFMKKSPKEIEQLIINTLDANITHLSREEYYDLLDELMGRFEIRRMGVKEEMDAEDGD